MPQVAVKKKDGKQLRQERNRRYQSKSEANAKKKERDRLYQQRKREQARLRCHPDPLAQLADVATQQTYLEEENDVIVVRDYLGNPVGNTA